MKNLFLLLPALLLSRPAFADDTAYNLAIQYSGAMNGLKVKNEKLQLDPRSLKDVSLNSEKGVATRSYTVRNCDPDTGFQKFVGATAIEGTSSDLHIITSDKYSGKCTYGRPEADYGVSSEHTKTLNFKNGDLASAYSCSSNSSQSGPKANMKDRSCALVERATCEKTRAIGDKLFELGLQPRCIRPIDPDHEKPINCPIMDMEKIAADIAGYLKAARPSDSIRKKEDAYYLERIKSVHGVKANEKDSLQTEEPNVKNLNGFTDKKELWAAYQYGERQHRLCDSLRKVFELADASAKKSARSKSAGSASGGSDGGDSSMSTTAD